MNCYDTDKQHSICEHVHAFQCGGNINRISNPLIKEPINYCRFSYIICGHKDVKEYIFMEPLYYGSQLKGHIELERIYMPKSCPKLKEPKQLSLY